MAIKYIKDWQLFDNGAKAAHVAGDFVYLFKNLCGPPALLPTAAAWYGGIRPSYSDYYIEAFINSGWLEPVTSYTVTGLDTNLVLNEISHYFWEKSDVLNSTNYLDYLPDFTETTDYSVDLINNRIIFGATKPNYFYAITNFVISNPLTVYYVDGTSELIPALPSGIEWSIKTTKAVSSITFDMAAFFIFALEPASGASSLAVGKRFILQQWENGRTYYNAKNYYFYNAALLNTNPLTNPPDYTIPSWKNYFLATATPTIQPLIIDTEFYKFFDEVFRYILAEKPLIEREQFNAAYSVEYGVNHYRLVFNDYSGSVTISIFYQDAAYNTAPDSVIINDINYGTINAGEGIEIYIEDLRSITLLNESAFYIKIKPAINVYRYFALPYQFEQQNPAPLKIFSYDFDIQARPTAWHVDGTGKTIVDNSTIIVEVILNDGSKQEIINFINSIDKNLIIQYSIAIQLPFEYYTRANGYPASRMQTFNFNHSSECFINDGEPNTLTLNIAYSGTWYSSGALSNDVTPYKATDYGIRFKSSIIFYKPAF